VIRRMRILPLWTSFLISSRSEISRSGIALR